MTNPIQVKVAPVGDRTVEVTVESGSNVESVLEVAGVCDEGRAITVNSNPGDLDTLVSSQNSIIVLANKMKGA